MEKELTKPKGLIERFFNTKFGKFITLISSNFVARVATLITIPLLLAGVTITGLVAPLAPAILIPVAVISLVAVIVGVVLDVIKVRKTRHFLKEYKLLRKLNLATRQREEILAENPKLNEILKDKLVIPSLDLHKHSMSSQRYRIPTSIARTIANQSAYVPLALVNSLTNPIILIAKSIKILFSFGLEVKNEYNLVKLRAELKNKINQERDKAPDYNNLQELAKIEREQRIQTLAIRSLDKAINEGRVEEKNYIQSFELLKQDINERTKPLKKYNKATSIAKDILRANNPLSQYQNPTKIQKKIDKDVELEKTIYHANNQHNRNLLNTKLNKELIQNKNSTSYIKLLDKSKSNIQAK